MVFVIMTIWEGTEKGHHRVYVLRQHRYGKPLWNVLEHPPPLVASTIIPPLREGRSASCCSMMARGSKRYVLRQQASNLD